MWLLFFVATALLRWKDWAHTPEKLVDIALLATALTAVSLPFNWWRLRQERKRQTAP